MEGADIFEIVDLLAQFMDQRDRAVTPIERQSWELVITMTGNADTVAELAGRIHRELTRNKGCTYRKVLRIAAALVTEVATPLPAHAGV